MLISRVATSRNTRKDVRLAEERIKSLIALTIDRCAFVALRNCCGSIAHTCWSRLSVDVSQTASLQDEW